MKKRETAKKLIYALFAAALFLLGPLCPAFVCADDEPEAETQYVVKYKESAGRLGEDGSLPFELVSEEEALRLDRAGLLEWYEPDGEGFLIGDEAALATPSYYESYQWNLDIINAEAAFEQGYLGRDVRVGVVDSGVNPHSALTANLLNGRRYANGLPAAADTGDGVGHGTMVAGLIAGAGDAGYIGVSPQAKIVPLKVTDGKGVMFSDVCAAVRDGIDNYGCKVINLSLGFGVDSNLLRETVEYAEKKGVVLVSAVGNDGIENLIYPAAYDTVIGVGSVDGSGNISPRSNHNESVFLTAPGVGVRSTDRYGGYTLGNGTSYAVPQVSGAAAMLMAIDPSLSPAEIRQILSETARDAGEEGYDEYYGYGVLNVSDSAALLTEDMVDPKDDPCSFLPASGRAKKIRNNTDAPLSVTYVLCGYSDSGRLLSMETYELTIDAKGTAPLALAPQNMSCVQLVYETGAAVPLTTERKSP